MCEGKGSNARTGDVLSAGSLEESLDVLNLLGHGELEKTARVTEE
jgi:hypothetical protein